MKHGSVYEYPNSREFLLAVFKQKQDKNPRYALRSWSKQMGFCNPMLLSRLLNNTTKMQPEVSRKISQALSLSTEESKYFELMSLFELANTPSEKELYQELIQSLRPELHFTSLEIDRFRAISDWYYLPIIEMTFLKDFESTPEWIAKRLGHGVTAEMAKVAIERLIRLGLLKRGTHGKLRKAPKGRLWAGDQGMQQAVQQYHTEMLERGKKAIAHQTPDERYLSSSTVVIKKSDLEKIQKIIQKCAQSIGRCSAQSDEGEAIYHVNIQCFRATEEK